MAEFFSILKRKTTGSSSSSESGALTPKEKRVCEPSFEADDEVNIALNMAEDFGSKLQLVSVTKIDQFREHGRRSPSTIQ